MHLDLDAFFCSVEVLKDPSLAGKPLVVGGASKNRGVVAAASYPARKYGIHSAMPMIEAHRRCKDLVVRGSSFGSYKMYSKIVMGILRDASPVIQQVSVDEAYLDLGQKIDEWVAASELARQVQLKISRDIGLSASVGLATNKMIAKIASDFDKPNGLTVVSPGDEERFLAPLKVSKIPGVGPKTTERLTELGVYKISDLRKLSRTHLESRFGKYGEAMWRWARGLDDRPVHEDHEAKSVSTERTFAKDIRDEQELLEILQKLSKKVAAELDKDSRAGATITIKVRYADFSTYTRQHTGVEAIWEGDDIYSIARRLFIKNWIPGAALRLLGVGVSNFTERKGQLRLKLE